ncbi:hypothetical protein SAY87_007207 [Trapa incisa]|uniref:Uncharacterized protein n=1 Tax=Trapa incisa TaxID=236973 RepID=A0AAN7JY36_9MYRT|nr:hypothetical protein SAY87_007207 [Trapa incisa]
MKKETVSIAPRQDISHRQTRCLTWAPILISEVVHKKAGIRRECRYLPPPPLLNSSSKVNTERVDGKARRPPTSAASSSSAA